MPDNCVRSRKRSGASLARNGKWKSKLNEERWKIGRSVPQWCRESFMKGTGRRE
jgi:hypothetical protein